MFSLIKVGFIIKVLGGGGVFKGDVLKKLACLRKGVTWFLGTNEKIKIGDHRLFLGTLECQSSLCHDCWEIEESEY